MSKRSGASGHPGRRKRNATGVPGHPGRRAAQQRAGGAADLAAEVAAVLKARDPLALLRMASTMLDVLDPRGRDPFAEEERAAPPLVDLLRSLAAAGPDTGALAWAMAVLSGDELARTAVLSELLVYGDRLPAWVDRLDEVQAVAAVQTIDALRDSSDVVVEVQVADATFTVVALIDFNLGGLIKDSFARAITSAEFTERWVELSEDGAGSCEPLDLADARARLEEAGGIAAATWPPVVSEEWPQTRPLLEWVVRHLPTGGADYDRPRLSPRRQATLARRFLDSPYAPQPFSDDDVDIVQDLLWYRTDWGFGDALRWSAPAVEILLVDWYPRKIAGDAAYLARMPEVLRALVAFAHARAKIPGHLTAETLACIDAYEPEYREAISVPRASTLAAMLERMGLDQDDELPDDLRPRTLRELVVDQVGGEEVLAALDDEPLPDEAFRWEGVPDELRDVVAGVLEECDAACDVLLDVEQRTAARRLLRDVVELLPAMFRRGNPRTVGAAVVSLIDRANDAQGRVPLDVLTAQLGVKAIPGTRVDSIRAALDSRHYSPLGPLRSTRYLGAAQRRTLLHLAEVDFDDRDLPLYR